MDPLILILIVGGGALLTVIALVMLNRAWGDFPGRISRPDMGQPPVQIPTSPGFTAPVYDEEGELPAGSPADGLILVTHPLARRAIMQALERGGSPYAAYFVRDGEKVYLAAHRISDPQQRAVAVRTFQAMSGDGPADLSIQEMIRAINQLGK